MVSPAFLPVSSLALAISYQISSSDISVELTLVSQLTGHVIQRHLLSLQRNFLVTGVSNTTGPIYLVLHAYPIRFLDAESPPVAVYVLWTFLIPDYGSKFKYFVIL